MVASEYGIKNLKRIISNLPEWTKDEAKGFDILKESYESVVDQFRRYLGHVGKYVGGIYETPMTSDQNNVVYEATPAVLQKSAVQFLSKNIFTTPTWIIDPVILNRIQPGQGLDNIRALQEPVIFNLLNEDRLQRMMETSYADPKAYGVLQLLKDMQLFGQIWVAPVRSIYSEEICRKCMLKDLMACSLPLPAHPGQYPCLVRPYLAGWIQRKMIYSVS